jgi:hypothetical protein
MSAFKQYKRRKVENPAHQDFNRPLPRNQYNSFLSGNITVNEYDLTAFHLMATPAHQYNQPTIPVLERNLSHGFCSAPSKLLQLVYQRSHNQDVPVIESTQKNYSVTNNFQMQLHNVRGYCPLDATSENFYNLLRQANNSKLIADHPRFDPNSQLILPHPNQPTVPQQCNLNETWESFQQARLSVSMTDTGLTATALAPFATLLSTKHPPFPPPITAPPVAADATAGPLESQGGTRRNAKRTVHLWGLAQWPADAAPLMRRQQQNREAQRRFREKARRLRGALEESGMGGISADSAD